MENQYSQEELLIDRQVEAVMSGEESLEGKEKKPGAVKGRSRKRKMVIAILILAVLGLFFRCSRGSSVKPFSASVISLSKGPIQEKISVSGPIEGTDSVDVVSGIHAEILSMNVKEGDSVKKGQILAVLDKTDLQREVEIARNAYDLAQANKNSQDKAQALGYEKAVQDFRAAQADYDRKSQLFSGGGISQVEMEAAANALADAKRHMEEYTVVNGVGAADPSYGLQVQAAAYTLEKAEKALENTEIKSPIDGTVVRVNSKAGQFADAVEDSKPIFSIENLEQLEMEIKISEYSIGKVKEGQKVAISADILNGKTVDGEVIKISPTGEEKGGGSTERVIPTTIRISDSSSGLIAGITAKAEILIREASDAFVVPVTALISRDDGTYIGVAENKKARLIPVETGVDGDVEMQVIPQEGYELAEGMQVITNPDGQLMDGAKIQISSQEGGKI